MVYYYQLLVFLYLTKLLLSGILKGSDLLKHLAIKSCKNLFLKALKKILKVLKNTRCINVLGRHYQVKNTVCEYSINTRKTILH